MRKRQGLLLIILAGIAVQSCTYTFYPGGCPYSRSHVLLKKAVLAPELNETSGLVVLDDGFLTINDSGGAAAVYAFDQKGRLRGTYPVAGASNMDWETLAADRSSIYIGDVGNNFGARDTLTIYKVPRKADGSMDNEKYVERIRFRFDEVVSKSSTGWFSHDCEAMFVYRDSIYLFAKDWVTQNTRVYVIPSEPGYYEVKSRKTYAVDALITGADIDTVRREVVLIGYRDYVPVLVRYSYLEDPAMIECGGKVRYFPSLIGRQVEGVAYDSRGSIYVTSEKTARKQTLYRAY